ncbi:hypothetical protein SNEBB_006362 [Seison nebaliae]|nr:hypothetical protein SNEBB_006362 [Seison nebaliae]
MMPNASLNSNNKFASSIEKLLEFKKKQKSDQIFETDEDNKESGIEILTDNSVDSTNKSLKKIKRKRRKTKQKEKRTSQKHVTNVNDILEEVKLDNFSINYVMEECPLKEDDENYQYFSKVFDRFKIEDENEKKNKELNEKENNQLKSNVNNFDMDLFKDPYNEFMNPSDVPTEEKKYSNRQMKQLTRMTIAELKQICPRPDTIEMHDITATDPITLATLKATRNSVQVPRHWNSKRKYLQGKRGFEKPPFKLPDFIENTGIKEMRGIVTEKDDKKSLKQKMREKARPRVGRVDIDYNKLHAAFFKFQTKPRMSIHGDLYYEGKEKDNKMKDKKPGILTDTLKIALGMPTGNGSNKVPPPWLIAMQRFGPPPSYPTLRIPGLNSPIPEGCFFGYYAGGWGKPPVDEHGKPLYGDVFGTKEAKNRHTQRTRVLDIDRRFLWGEMVEEDEVSSDEDIDIVERDQDGKDDQEISETNNESTIHEISSLDVIDVDGGGTHSEKPSGIESCISMTYNTKNSSLDDVGQSLDITKNETKRLLYHVIPEKVTDASKGLMGSNKIYDLSKAKSDYDSGSASSHTDGAISGYTSGYSTNKTSRNNIDIALQPHELENLSQTELIEKFQKQQQQQSSSSSATGNDPAIDQMFVEQQVKQEKRKMKTDSSIPQKKYKDFKF